MVHWRKLDTGIRRVAARVRGAGGKACMGRKIAMSAAKRLRQRTNGLVLWGGLSLLLVPHLLAAFQAEEQLSTTKVIVGSATSSPGSPADIPLTLFGRGPSGITTLVITIRFPKKALSMTAATPGLASELAEAKVQTSIQEASDSSDAALLEVTVSGGKTLSPGTLATLKFRVAEEAPLGKLRLELKETQ